MKEKLKRTLLMGALIALGTVTAYFGLLTIGLLMGALAVFVAADEKFRIFGDEEDQVSEGEES